MAGIELLESGGTGLCGLGGLRGAFCGPLSQPCGCSPTRVVTMDSLGSFLDGVVELGVGNASGGPRVCVGGAGVDALLSGLRGGTSLVAGRGPFSGKVGLEFTSEDAGIEC